MTKEENMKAIILILSISILNTAFSSGSFSINGSLIVEQSQKIIIESAIGQFKIRKANNIKNCSNGSYKIASVGNNTFELLKVERCDSYNVRAEELTKINLDSNDDFYNCGKIYEPVCGTEVNPNCLAGSECNSLKIPRTFTNICNLNRAGATKLFKGSCNSSLTTILDRELPTHKFVR
jgi:hypothetical protein